VADSTSQKADFPADRVAAAGAVLALIAMALLPLAILRPNRIAVQHTPIVLWQSQAWGVVLPALALLALVLAVWPKAPWRGIALKATAALLFVATAWALGQTATRILTVLHDPSGYARVSVAAGAWLVIVGAAMIDFASRKREYSGGWVRLGLNLVTVLGILAAAMWGGLLHLSIFVEYQNQTDLFWSATVQHIFLSLSGLAFGALIGIPLGILAARNRTIRGAALGITGVFQTLPSLAFLGLLVVPLGTLAATYPFLRSLGIQGIGAAPAIIALTVYALLPIVRNTYVGLDGVDPAATDAGRGMGMSDPQLLWRVQMPLALPLVIEGLRASAVLVIGIAVVTALVGAGGLGVIVFLGLGSQAEDLIVLGAVPVIVLAIMADAAARGIGRVAVSPGIRSDLAREEAAS
jgi:osmoprotectant transport system permease protein